MDKILLLFVPLSNFFNLTVDELTNAEITKAELQERIDYISEQIEKTREMNKLKTSRVRVNVQNVTLE